MPSSAPGVYASHGYERSHVKGVENTLRLDGKIRRKSLNPIYPIQEIDTHAHIQHSGGAGRMPDAEAAALTVCRAIRAAEVPAGLRFSLSRRLEKAFWDVWPRLGLQAQVQFYGEREGFAGALADDASHTLLMNGEYDFGPKWDQELLRRFAKTARREALLTGHDRRGGRRISPAGLPARPVRAV